MPLETDRDHERELRSFFEAVHRQQAPPPFRSLWRERRPRRSGRRALIPRLAVAGTLAAVMIWALLRTPGGPEEPATGDAALEVVAAGTLTGWRGPLDFLLRTPGRELLESTPAFSVELPPMPTETAPEKERRPDHEA